MIAWIYNKALRLKDIQGAKVLDIGCGAGRGLTTPKQEYLHNIEDLAQDLLAQGLNVTGIDIKDIQVKYPNFTFIRENFLQSSLPSKSFDLVISCQTWNLIGKKYPGAGTTPEAFDSLEGDKNFIKQVDRVLKDDGTVLLACTIQPGKYDSSFRSLTIERIEEDLTGYFEIIDSQIYSLEPGLKEVLLELKKGKNLGKKLGTFQ